MNVLVLNRKVRKEQPFDLYYKNGLPIATIDSIKKKHLMLGKMLRKKYSFLGFLWPAAHEKFDQITDELSYFCTVKNYRDCIYGYDNLVHLFNAVYPGGIRFPNSRGDSGSPIRLLELEVQDPGYQRDKDTGMPVSTKAKKIQSLIDTRHRNVDSDFRSIIYITGSLTESESLGSLVGLGGQ